MALFGASSKTLRNKALTNDTAGTFRYQI